jgi:cell division septation protein DedD
MPKSVGGFIGWLVGTLIVVAVGVAVLSRLPGWSTINRT